MLINAYDMVIRCSHGARNPVTITSAINMRYKGLP
jgi:hypothetical protein